MGFCGNAAAAAVLALALFLKQNKIIRNNYLNAIISLITTDLSQALVTLGFFAITLIIFTSGSLISIAIKS